MVRKYANCICSKTAINKNLMISVLKTVFYIHLLRNQKIKQFAQISVEYVNFKRLNYV